MTRLLYHSKRPRRPTPRASSFRKARVWRKNMCDVRAGNGGKLSGVERVANDVNWGVPDRTLEWWGRSVAAVAIFARFACISCVQFFFVFCCLDFVWVFVRAGRRGKKMDGVFELLSPPPFVLRPNFCYLFSCKEKSRACFAPTIRNVSTTDYPVMPIFRFVVRP